MAFWRFINKLFSPHSGQPAQKQEQRYDDIQPFMLITSLCYQPGFRCCCTAARLKSSYNASMN